MPTPAQPPSPIAPTDADAPTDAKLRERLRSLAEGLVDGAREGRTEGAGAVTAGILRPGAEPIVVTAGRTISFGPDGAFLPEDDPRSRPVDADTLFDMASVTKVVTALVAATFLEEGTLRLEESAADHLGTEAVPDTRITVRHLLTHTSGLPPIARLWEVPGGREDRLAAIARVPLAAEPGTRHAYSCLGFLLLGRLLEGLGGISLPELARERVLEPARARTASWGVADADRERTAATEDVADPPRGRIQGEVHDENAWSIGGAGNAGLFATTADALAIGRILAGTAPGPVLSPAVRELLGTDQLGDAVPTDAPWHQGIGLRIGQALPDGSVLPGVLGHPGFTGTALWADPATGTVAALLTNRVHPDRERFEIVHARQEFARLAFAAGGPAGGAA